MREGARSVIYSILAGAMAAFISFYLNTKALKLGKWSIIYIAPFVEEFTKTYLALYLGSSIIFTHMIFGCIEAIYDIIDGKSIIRYVAGGAAFLSHSIFGIITEYVLISKFVPLIAVGCSYIIHLLFNMTILWYSRQA